jgi:hypothetical protein
MKMIYLSQKKEREGNNMARATYKKEARTKFVGQCAQGGGRWAEPARTKKQANRKTRYDGKRACAL